MQPNTQSRHYIQYHWNQIALMYMWTFVNLCTCENLQLRAWRNRGNNLAPHSLTYLLLLLCWEWAEENFTPAFRSLRSSSSWLCVYVCVSRSKCHKRFHRKFLIAIGGFYSFYTITWVVLCPCTMVLSQSAVALLYTADLHLSVFILSLSWHVSCHSCKCEQEWIILSARQ